MTTSLARQLKKLAAPQTSVLKLDKRKPSLLFEEKEAADLNRDEVYNIGLSGLDELEQLDDRFLQYRTTLFSPASKGFERGIQTAAINKKIDEQVDEFLILISPYVPLIAAHKALEWLVNRYQIHLYNVDSLVMCFLPYHETKIFVRAVCLLDLRDETGRWCWLQTLQKPKIPLPKKTLLNHCSSDIGFLKFICSMLKKATEVHATRGTVMNTFIAFYSTTLIGMLENLNKVKEEQLAVILPSLLYGLGSKNPDHLSACFMIIAQLTKETKLTQQVIEDIIGRVIKAMHRNVVLEGLTLLVALCRTQEIKAFSIPKNAIKSLIWNEQLIPAMETLALTFEVSPFVAPMIENLVVVLSQQTLENRFDKLAKFLQNIVDEIKFNGEDSSVVIKSYLCGYLNCMAAQLEPTIKDKLKKVIKEIVDRLEKQYPIAFERSIHLTMSSKASDKSGFEEDIRDLFGFTWEADHTTLFLKLNHNSAETRAAAAQAVVTALQNNQVRNMNFAVSAIVERLVDCNPAVVIQILRLGEDLYKFLPQDKQFQILLTAFRKGSHGEASNWKMVRIGLISLLYNGKFVSELNDDQRVELFIAALPYLFPSTGGMMTILKALLSSDYIHMSPLLEAINSDAEMFGKVSCGKICEHVFQIIQRSTPFSSAELNSKLFRRIVSQMEETWTHSSIQLPAILLVPSLIRSVQDPSSSFQMSTEFVDALVSLMNVCKVYNGAKIEKSSIHPFLLQAQGGVMVLDSLVNVAMEVFEHAAVDYTLLSHLEWASPFSPDSSNLHLQFLLRTFRFLVLGLNSRSTALFRKNLQLFFERMEQPRMKLFFLSLVWNDPLSHEALRVVSLKMAAQCIIVDVSSFKWTLDYKSFVIPQILCSLASDNAMIRQSALALTSLLSAIVVSNRELNKSFISLVRRINEASEELKMDAEQLKVIMANHMQQKTTATTSSALFGFIMSPDVPGHVKHGLLLALEHVNSTKILTSLLPVLNDMMIDGEQTAEPLKSTSSSVLSLLLERFTPHSASILSSKNGWESFLKGLRTSKCFLSTTENVVLAPQDILIEVVTKEFVCAIPKKEIKLSIVKELLDIITTTDKTVTARQARRALKRISFDAELLLESLEFIPHPAKADEEKGGMVSEMRSRRRQVSLKPSQSPQWNKILAVLEMLQIKKGITNVNLLIAPLFDLLKHCLNEDEQAPLEYSKQLILSCLLTCCQKLSPGDIVKLASEFKTGGIVQCIRVSNNPQTHHQALLLLSLAAELFPSQVLTNIMEIFTFMGTSVLRQDDAYSFQVIAKTLESVIPTLIEASKKTAVEPVVTTVIHVFADALPEVPEHRRIPVFDKLLTTLDPEVYLWLAPTLILSNMATQGPRLGKMLIKEEDSKDRMAADVEFSLNVCHLYQPRVQLKACIRMMEYLHSLPLEKQVQRTPSATTVDMTEGSVPFSLDIHTTRQLCNFKLFLVNFISTLLSSNQLIERLVELDENEKQSLEELYRHLIEVALKYTQSISRVVDQPLASGELGPNPKFWRALLHRCYDVIDRINSLLPRSMFISVVRKLLEHAIPSIRRRAMELLSAKLQHQSNFFVLTEDESSLVQLIQPLTSIAQGQGLNEEAALNQQTAFFTLKLVCRLLGPSSSASFRPVMDMVIDIISPKSSSSVNVLASAFLCLAELIQNMAVQSLPYLPRYGNNLIARLEDMSVIESHELLLLSVVTALYKLVETLAQFLVPYLSSILKKVCYLSAKYSASEKPTQLVSRLQNIRHCLATSSSPKSLIASVTEVYSELTGIESGSFAASPSIGPLMSIVSESFTAMSRDELANLLPALTAFFVKALDSRAILSAQSASLEEMNMVEEPVVAALVSLVLKLSEASFRPLFFQLYDWATRSDAGKERLVSFYNVTMQIAEKLKGLFVGFAGHFIRNAAQVLIDTNFTVKEELPFSGPYAEQNTLMLLEYVLRCLYRICLHDNENFMTKERFETLMEPLVEQLENELGAGDVAQQRVQELLVPLLAQMAVAAGEDNLWKSLHFQLLSKTKSPSANVRLASLKALSAFVEKLGEDYYSILPEAMPALAELLEDDVPEVEIAAQSTIQYMGDILGEPLQKYF